VSEVRKEAMEAALARLQIEEDLAELLEDQDQVKLTRCTRRDRVF
jgi:hypothetical protein